MKKNINKSVIYQTKSGEIKLRGDFDKDTIWATQFRIWATKVLKQHITQGYTINKKVLRKNYDVFLQTVKDIEILAKENRLLKSADALEFVRAFSF